MSDSRLRAKAAPKAAGVPRLFWSVREFAEATGLAVDTVYRLIARGELAAVRLGELRIPNSEIERLISEACGAVQGGAA